LEAGTSRGKKIRFFWGLINPEFFFGQIKEKGEGGNPKKSITGDSRGRGEWWYSRACPRRAEEKGR